MASGPRANKPPLAHLLHQLTASQDGARLSVQWCTLSLLMCEHNDEVANAVLEKFHGFPRKGKPRVYSDGLREWTVLSGLVLSTKDGEAEHFECVSMGTGMRCNPRGLLPSMGGLCLHDWHAEVVAMRAFNLYLLHECEKLASDAAYVSPHLVWRADRESAHSEMQPFAIRKDVRIHMYCSEAPCGDASMELIMNAQGDATPWSQHASPSAGASHLEGRGFFDQLGTVRRKPARADAPPSWSKSCSDKVAMKQCTSLLSSVLSLLVHPGNAYLSDLILPRSQVVPGAIRRAFSEDGRMSGATHLARSWKGGYTFRPIKCSSVDMEFEYCRPRGSTASKSKGSNLTAMWTPLCQEVIIGGSIQGSRKLSQRGASAISRSRTWHRAAGIAAMLAIPRLMEALKFGQEYSAVKHCELLGERQRVKDDVRAALLKPWPQNDGDNEFVLGP